MTATLDLTRPRSHCVPGQILGCSYGVLLKLCSRAADGMQVRASRAYVAGFGTAGSLLAGASILFVLASAIVSFRGWPQVGNQPSSVPAIVTESPAPALPPLGRVAAAAAGLPGRPFASAAGRAAPGRAAALGAAVSGSGPTVTRSAPAVSRSGLPAPTGSVAITGAGPGTPSCAGGGCVVGPSAGEPGSTVQGATGTLGNSVATTGANLGSAVTGITGPLARGLPGVSPSVAGSVNNLGQALGGTVTGATGAVAGTLSAAGQTLGGILGSPHR